MGYQFHPATHPRSQSACRNTSWIKMGLVLKATELHRLRRGMVEMVQLPRVKSSVLDVLLNSWSQTFHRRCFRDIPPGNKAKTSSVIPAAPVAHSTQSIPRCNSPFYRSGANPFHRSFAQQNHAFAFLYFAALDLCLVPVGARPTWCLTANL